VSFTKSSFQKSIISTSSYTETFLAIYKKLSAHLWEPGNWLLHKENILTGVYWSKSIWPWMGSQSFHNFPTLKYIPANYYIFPRLKTLLKGHRCQSVEVKCTTMVALQKVTGKRLHECFQLWYGCSLKCVAEKVFQSWHIVKPTYRLSAWIRSGQNWSLNRDHLRSIVYPLPSQPP
jgi:hypothetical protein